MSQGANRYSKDRRLERLDRLGELLDDSIQIPLIRYRIGYDALIGLIPGAGDVVGLAMSTYIVVQAARYRIPRSTLLRMITNVAVEALVGAIPVVGDLFDAVYKANLRNLRLLHKRLQDGETAPRSDRAFFATVILIPILAGAAIFAALVWGVTLLF